MAESLPPGPLCLSLRVLARLAIAEPARPEVLNLSGIGRLDAIVVDRENRDIILVGEHAGNGPSLHLDDLVGNLRGIWNGGLDPDGGHPSCSLDPRPQDIRNLNAYLPTLKPGTTSASGDVEFARISQLCGPQMVFVGGVPKNSRHAHVMIDADYHMKKVSQGHVTIEGIPSTLDLAEQRYREWIRTGGKASVPAPAMSRFWFNVKPGEPKLVADGGSVALVSCAVVLLTEKQAAAANGALRDSGQEDPLANAFAAAFSQRFEQAATLVPVYADLANLYRLRALLQALRRQDDITALVPELDELLRRYRFQAEKQMPPSYPGLANRRKMTDERAGVSFTSLVMGGVSMEMRTDNIRADPTPALASLRRRATRSRPHADSLAWALPAGLPAAVAGRSGNRVMTAAEGEAFARLYDEVSGAGESPGVSVVGRKLGGFEVINAYPPSHTDLRAFRVVDTSGVESIVKVLPNDGEGRNRRQLEAAVQIAKYLAEKGENVPAPLPMHPENGGEVLTTRTAVLMRESVAQGEELGNVAAVQNGRLNSEQERLYVDKSLELALRGKGLPDQIAAKPALTTSAAMRKKLLERADESRDHFGVFAQTGLYQKEFAGAAPEMGRSFDSSYRAFIEHFWKGDSPLVHTGLVHDAILRNYFLHEGKMSVIDVGSDYVGDIGNVISTLSTQLQSPAESYPTYKARIEGMLSSYSKKIGRPLSEADRREILIHLPLQPYKMLSSDSGRMLSQAKKACALRGEASDAELLDAMRRPENQSKVEAFLSDAQTREKYRSYMLNIKYSLMLLDEHFPVPNGQEKTILKELIDKVDNAIKTGLRVVILPERAERAGGRVV